MRLFRRRSWQRHGLPCRRALLPSVVGQRPLIRAVGLHDDQLAIGLRDVRHWRFVLESEARRAEQHVLAIGRTGWVGIVIRPLVSCVSDVPSGLMAKIWNSSFTNRLKTMRPFADQHGKLS